jgi:Flp pilus assembly protein TadG
MNFWRSTRRRDERGQVLVIVAVGMVVIIAMVGIVIDGGYAWGKQRETQNGADSASEAGAAMLAWNLAYTTRKLPAPKTDTDVLAAVNAAGNANDIGNPDAYYTNFDGDLLDATGAIVADTALAAKVGDGVIPAGTWGVRANGQQTFDTFLARVIGFNQFTTTTTATARAGYQTSTCAAGAGCAILPVTVPVTVLTCDGSNNPVPKDPPEFWPSPSGVEVIPLCKNGPGNVGWLDWSPTGGGASELEDAILNPSNPALKWPGWYYITSTGNVNSKPIEDALRTYDGALVQFPQFDLTCDATPDPDPSLPNYGCPSGHVGGNGSNQWYHLAGMSSFTFCSGTDTDCSGGGYLHGAYVNGNNKSVCDTGNGATSCLVGKFEAISYEGEVSAAPPPNPASANVGVQLIR